MLHSVDTGQSYVSLVCKAGQGNFEHDIQRGSPELYSQEPCNTQHTAHPYAAQAENILPAVRWQRQAFIEGCVSPLPLPVDQSEGQM